MAEGSVVIVKSQVNLLLIFSRPYQSMSFLDLVGESTLLMSCLTD